MEKVGPLVSSAHLAAGALPELSEMEFALIMAGNAFARWITRGMAAAGQPEMSALEVEILHAVNHRDRPKTLADLCLVLNIEDTHTVAYALKKLEKKGLVTGGRAGKVRTASITAAGAAACAAYAAIREAALVAAVREIGVEPAQLGRLAAALRALSGSYDQAARAAASL